MKLTAAQIKQTASKLNAQPIADEGRLAPELSKMFGEHTFFLNGAGLHIVDLAEPDESVVMAGRVVKLASWADPNSTTLAPHDPEFTDIIIELEKAA